MKGVTGSDIPAQSSGKTYGGVAKDTLGTGQGKRERAPAGGLMASDNPSTVVDTCGGSDDLDTSETLTGNPDWHLRRR